MSITVDCRLAVTTCNQLRTSRNSFRALIKNQWSLLHPLTKGILVRRYIQQGKKPLMLIQVLARDRSIQPAMSDSAFFACDGSNRCRGSPGISAYRSLAQREVDLLFVGGAMYRKVARIGLDDNF
jgi:hypothetical protein